MDDSRGCKQTNLPFAFDCNRFLCSVPKKTFVLIDWKQGDQAGWEKGLAISRVTGAIDSHDVNSDAWQHTGNVELLERAATLGTTGWAGSTPYNFQIEFTASNIKLFIDGVKQFDINGTFENGSFGFYNHSQESVRYAGLTTQVLPPTTVPEPTSLAIFCIGACGCIGRRRRRRA